MGLELEVHGNFWLPGADDRKVPGILTFTPGDGGRLALIGSLEDEEDFFNASSKDCSRIVGRDEKTFYTLDGCLRTYSRFSIGGFEGRQGFRVGQIIKNIHYEKDEAVHVEALGVDLQWLLQWTNRSGIHEEITFTEAAKKYQDIKLVGVPLDAVGVEADFGRLELRHRLNRAGGGITGSSLSQDIYAWFGFNRSLLLAEALDYASDLQDLVSIATHRPAAFGLIRFYDSSWVDAASDPQKRLRTELHSEWRVKTQTYKRDLRSSDMLFTFEQLGGIGGVKRWMTAAEKYRELLGRVMVTRYAQEPVVQDIVLNRVAPLEAFHRLWSGVSENQMYLADRLDGLIAYAGESFEKLIGAGNAPKWRQKAKSHRHDIAHHLGRHTGLDAAELFYVGQGAYWLFVMCLLREAGAPQEVFDHMVECQRFQWESKEIQGVL